MKFYGVKKEDKPKIFNSKDYSAFFDSLQNGEEFEITVTKVKDIRSHKMNNLYWWWLSIISDNSGYTKKELHNYFKEELLCEEKIVNEKTILDCKSTSELTNQEYVKYLNEVNRIATQHFNCFLPDQDSIL